MVKRVRGVAWATRVSPQMCNRLVDGARGVLNELLADVYIFTDHMVHLHIPQDTYSQPTWYTFTDHVVQLRMPGS